jgi:hypothetical protein
MRRFHAGDSHVSRKLYSGGYSHQFENRAANQTIALGKSARYWTTISSPRRLVRAWMWVPSAGLVSSRTSWEGGNEQAATELEKTNRRRPRPRDSSSTLRSPSMLVRTYSGCASPVKS